MAHLVKGKQIKPQTVTINGTSGNVIATGDFSLSGYKISTSATTFSTNDLVTRAYVDSVAAGLDPKESVRVISPVGVEINLTGVTVIDGYILQNNDRVLVKNQSNAIYNGIYYWNSGDTHLYRSLDSDGTPSNEVTLGNYTFVETGTTGSGTGWVLSSTDSPTSIIIPGVNTQVWTQYSGAGTYTADNQGITLGGTQFSLVLDGTTLSKSGTGLKINDSYTTTISQNLSTSMSSEVSTRLSVDTSLSTTISTESSVRLSVDTSLSTSLSTETSNRVSGDTSLSTGLSSEISNRVSGDSSLSTIRLSGDNSLSTSLSTESSTRLSVDTSLSTIRLSGDNSLSTSLSTESSTRLSVDTSLSTAISNISNPIFVEKLISPADSGSTTSVLVDLLGFPTLSVGETVQESSVTMILNGIGYLFAYAQGSPVVFHTNNITPNSSTPTSIYFDGVSGGFTIETDDVIILKYTKTN